MKRIAIVRTCALGDAVQCTPLLQQVRADAPDAKITFFTSTNVLSLFEDASFVDETVGMNPEHLTIPAGRRGMTRAWWEVAKHGPFDALISLEPTWMRNLGSKLVRAPIKAGFSFTGKRKPFELFTHSLPLDGDSRKIKTHASQHYIDLWLLITGGGDRGFDYNMRHLLNGESASSDGQPSICIAPGTGNVFFQYATKQWHIASYIELGERLLREGWRVTYLGGHGDLGSQPPPVGASNLLGKTTLREVANLLHQSTVLVGNDSGLFHLAQGVGCPAIGIFGPTSPQFTGVFRSTSAATVQANLPCMPCYQDTCHFAGDLPKPCCMSEVSVDQVIRKITELVSQTQPRTLNSSL